MSKRKKGKELREKQEGSNHRFDPRKDPKYFHEKKEKGKSHDEGQPTYRKWDIRQPREIYPFIHKQQKKSPPKKRGS